VLRGVFRISEETVMNFRTRDLKITGVLAAGLATLFAGGPARAQCPGPRQNRPVQGGIPQQSTLFTALPQLQYPLLTALQQQSTLTALQQRQTALQAALDRTTTSLSTLQQTQASEQPAGSAQQPSTTTATQKKLAALKKKQAALQKALQQTNALLAALQSAAPPMANLLQGPPR
jgi:hypothetical protein